MNRVSLETGEIVQVKFSFLHLCDDSRSVPRFHFPGKLADREREAFFQLEELVVDYVET